MVLDMRQYLVCEERMRVVSYLLCTSQRPLQAHTPHSMKTRRERDLQERQSTLEPTDLGSNPNITISYVALAKCPHLENWGTEDHLSGMLSGQMR